MHPPAAFGRIALVALAATTVVAAASQPGRAEFDLLIKGGVVVDGTGRPRFRADVAIKADKVADVNPAGIASERAAAVLTADRMIVAPGFIDQHAHIQTTIHEYPLAENFTRQGVTTILASLHAGDQPWPLDRYMADLKAAPNVGFFAGHSWVRTKVLGLANRAPTSAELETMKGLVDESMRAGALGLSTGLVYVPGNYAKTEEIIELAKVAARHNGIYVSHMRDEATGLLESIAELIRICREAGLPGQIQHHKAVGVSQWGWSAKSLAMIEEARASGLDIKHDLYPYTASSTGSSVLFPQWALADGPKGFAARVADAAQRRKIEAEMRDIFVKERGGNDLSRVQFRVVRSDPRYNGKTLADLARDRNLPNTVDSGIQLVIDLQLKGGFSAIYHSIDENDVQAIMRHPMAMFDTDADLVEYGFGFPHPRSYGTFPRVLGRYVRELKVLALEEAIRRMTSLSADQIGHRERGRLAAGMFADVTVFDPETVADIATFSQPHQYPIGIRHVVVNGVPIIRNGALTGAKPGRVLKGPARPVSSSSRLRAVPAPLPELNW